MFILTIPYKNMGYFRFKSVAQIVMILKLGNILRNSYRGNASVTPCASLTLISILDSDKNL